MQEKIIVIHSQLNQSANANKLWSLKEGSFICTLEKEGKQFVYHIDKNKMKILLDDLSPDLLPKTKCIGVISSNMDFDYSSKYLGLSILSPLKLLSRAIWGAPKLLKRFTVHPFERGKNTGAVLVLSKNEKVHPELLQFNGLYAVLATKQQNQKKLEVIPLYDKESFTISDEAKQLYQHNNLDSYSYFNENMRGWPLDRELLSVYFTTSRVQRCLDATPSGTLQQILQLSKKSKINKDDSLVECDFCYSHPFYQKRTGYSHSVIKHILTIAISGICNSKPFFHVEAASDDYNLSLNGPFDEYNTETMFSFAYQDCLYSILITEAGDNDERNALFCYFRDRNTFYIHKKPVTFKMFRQEKIIAGYTFLIKKSGKEILCVGLFSNKGMLYFFEIQGKTFVYRDFKYYNCHLLVCSLNPYSNEICLVAEEKGKLNFSICELASIDPRAKLA